MSKLYNNNNTIVKRFSNFFKKFTKSKTLLNFVPGMFYSMI